jgi:hypothetical protein
MKSCIIRTTSAILLLACTSFMSCNKDKQITNNVGNAQLISGNYTDVDSNFIYYDFAESIAQRLPKTYFDGEEKVYLSPADGYERNISSGFELKLEDAELPGAYLFNYSDGGFVVISADARYKPILSFSTEGSINQSDSILEPIYEWAVEQAMVVGEIRSGLYADPTTDDGAINANIIIGNMNEWKHFVDDMGGLGSFSTIVPHNPWLDDKGNNANCPRYYKLKSPLLKTKWSQQAGFNNLLSQGGCSNTFAWENGKVPVGCVPVATAQLLKYWNKPNATYNYNNMPLTVGSYATQTLMRDLGTFLNVQYACSGSGAYASDIHNVLLNNFNYVSPGIYGNYTNSSKWEVVSELDVNRIVILDGYASKTVTVKKKFFGLFKKTTTTLDNGHTWICDGYEITGDICNKNVMLYMSWGNYQGDNNAFFHESNWVSYSTNYQYQKKFYKYIFPS